MPTPNYDELARRFVLGNSYVIACNSVGLTMYTLDYSTSYLEKKYGKNNFDSSYYRNKVISLITGGE